MTCSVGPKVATSGLVFEYDMSNTKKSFKGAPTTNLLPQPLTLSTGYTKESWTTGEVVDNAIVAPDGTLSATRIKRVSGYLYKANGTAPTFTISPGQTITFSAWVLKLDSLDQTGRGLYIWCYNGAGSGNRTSATQSINSNQWVYQSVTYTALTGETSFAFGFVGSSATHIQSEIAIWHPQIEIQTFATPFTTTSRSTTQAILDLTGLNTITATSLTYASDNTFSFGTTSSAAITGVLPTLNQDVTLVAVVNQLTASGPHQTAICTDKNYCYGVKLMSSYHGSIAAWVADSVASTNKLTLITGPDIQNAGYKMIALTRTTAGVVNLYLNGILQNSSSAADTGNTAVAGTSWIGMEYHSISYGFNGKIPYTAAYNRALTSAEVLQNFNALRGRYGI